MWGFCFDLDETIWSQGDPQLICFPYSVLGEERISLRGGELNVRSIFSARYKKIFQEILRSKDIIFGFITSGLWDRSDIKDFFRKEYEINLGDDFFFETRCRKKVSEFDLAQGCMVRNRYPDKGPKLIQVKEDLQYRYDCKRLLFFDDSLNNIMVGSEAGWEAIFMPHMKDQVSDWLQLNMMKKLKITDAQCYINLIDIINDKADTISYFFSGFGGETKIAEVCRSELDANGIATISLDDIQQAIDDFMMTRSGVSMAQHNDVAEGGSSDTLKLHVMEDGVGLFFGTSNGIKLKIAINYEALCYQGLELLERAIGDCQYHHRRQYISKIFHGGELDPLDHLGRWGLSRNKKNCCDPVLMCGQPSIMDCV